MTEQQAPHTASVHHIPVRRTARYYTLGEISSATREIWFVIHGYGQLAEYFIRHFRGLDDGTRFIVAPEALSRFYVKEWTRVGASWITKEERENEIADYVQYLSDVRESILEQLEHNGGDPVTVSFVGCGFSQGVTTLSRWLLRANIHVERLLCWAGTFAGEIDMVQHHAVFNRMKPILVCGTRDEFISPEALQTQLSSYREKGLNIEFVSFEGEHVMVSELLQEIVRTW
jgi:predicted esterase